MDEAQHQFISRVYFNQPTAADLERLKSLLLGLQAALDFLQYDKEMHYDSPPGGFDEAVDVLKLAIDKAS